LPSFSFLPSQPKFFVLFEKASANLLACADALQDLLQNYTDVPDKVAHITTLEQAGDSIVHEVTNLAHTSLIAPLDNEDSQRLIVALDDVVDAIEASAVRMAIFQVEQPSEVARQLAEVIKLGARQVNEAMPGLRSRGQLEKMRTHIQEINRLENVGDEWLRKGLEELVNYRNDAYNLIRWKEIYENLEESTDRIEDVGDVLQGVLIKNA
jgi:predicted phosphate transport protein (TIGR00153 family)